MAKKKEKQPSWGGEFKEMNTNLTELNRAKRQAEKKHVAKIPTCNIFMNGQKVVLNGN